MCQLKAPARSFCHNLITRLFAINRDLAEKLICSYCRKYLYQKKDKYLGASAEIFKARVFPKCPLFLSICGNSRCRLFWWCVRSVCLHNNSAFATDLSLSAQVSVVLYIDSCWRLRRGCKGSSRSRGCTIKYRPRL